MCEPAFTLFRIRGYALSAPDALTETVQRILHGDVAGGVTTFVQRSAPFLVPLVCTLFVIPLLCRRFRRRRFLIVGAVATVLVAFLASLDLFTEYLRIVCAVEELVDALFALLDPVFECVDVRPTVDPFFDRLKVSKAWSLVLVALHVVSTLLLGVRHRNCVLGTLLVLVWMLASATFFAAYLLQQVDASVDTLVANPSAVLGDTLCVEIPFGPLALRPCDLVSTCMATPSASLFATVLGNLTSGGGLLGELLGGGMLGEFGDELLGDLDSVLSDEATLTFLMDVVTEGPINTTLAQQVFDSFLFEQLDVDNVTSAAFTEALSSFENETVTPEELASSVMASLNVSANVTSLTDLFSLLPGRRMSESTCFVGLLPSLSSLRCQVVEDAVSLVEFDLLSNLLFVFSVASFAFVALALLLFGAKPSRATKNEIQLTWM